MSFVTGVAPGARFWKRGLAGACLGAALATLIASASCDSENACSTSCPTGTRFTNDGTCACEPFDAGYCSVLKDCPDAFCPASDAAGACGAGQAWSTTICGCYPLPEAGLHHD